MLVVATVGMAISTVVALATVWLTWRAVVYAKRSAVAAEDSARSAAVAERALLERNDVWWRLVKETGGWTAARNEGADAALDVRVVAILAGGKRTDAFAERVEPGGVVAVGWFDDRVEVAGGITGPLIIDGHITWRSASGVPGRQPIGGVPGR